MIAGTVIMKTSFCIMITVTNMTPPLNIYLVPRRAHKKTLQQQNFVLTNKTFKKGIEQENQKFNMSQP